MSHHGDILTCFTATNPHKSCEYCELRVSQTHTPRLRVSAGGSAETIGCEDNPRHDRTTRIALIDPLPSVTGLAADG